MNRFIAGVALAALLASPALARSPHDRTVASPNLGYAPSVPGASLQRGVDTEGNYLADPDPFIRNQLLHQYEMGEP